MTARDLCPVIVDTREPAIDAGDHPDSVFQPRILGPCPRDTPFADRPRIALPTVRAKLDVGDYSVRGLEDVIALERKSGADLLATLFGEDTNALGECAPNVDRFRAELERAYAKRMALFAIVCEGSIGWLYTEAKRRRETYGKSFDPERALEMLDSFAVDLACPTLWCGSKGVAELRVGFILSRVWAQAIGGKAAKKAKARGYTAIPWLDALAGTKAETATEDAGT